MKNSLLFLATAMLLVFVPVVNSQITEKRDLPEFHSLNISSEIDAELILSEKEGIDLEIENANPLSLISEVKKGVLTVKMKTGSYKDAVLKVKIHFKDLKEIESTGRASVWSQEDIYLDELSIKLYNGGATRLRLYCDDVDINISQGSILTLKGEGKSHCQFQLLRQSQGPCQQLPGGQSFIRGVYRLCWQPCPGRTQNQPRRGGSRNHPGC